MASQKQKENDAKKRLDFLLKQQQNVNGLIAKNGLLASTLAGEVIGGGYDTTNPSSVGELLFELEAIIDRDKDRLVLDTTEAMGRMADLGVEHAVQSINTSGQARINTADYIGLGREIAEIYARGDLGAPNPGRPTNLTPQELTMAARTKGRLLDAVQDDIEILSNRTPTIGGYRYFKGLVNEYGEQLGGAVNMPFRFYGEALAESLGMSVDEMDAYIMGAQGRDVDTSLNGRLWNDEVKRQTLDVVANGLVEQKSAFEVAQDLQQFVAEGTPRYMLDRIASTELVKAYSKAKYEIYRRIVDTIPNAKAYVEVSLNPFHPKPDICDLLQGTYELDDAPMVPIHPFCICLRREFIAPASRSVRTTTIYEQITSQSNKILSDGISIPQHVDGRIIETPPSVIFGKLDMNQSYAIGKEKRDGYFIVEFDRLTKNAKLTSALTFTTKSEEYADMIIEAVKAGKEPSGRELKNMLGLIQ